MKIKNVTLVEGIRLKIFDNTLYIDDKTTPLSVTMKPATIQKVYFDKIHGRLLADVIFDHRPDKVSKGHFIDIYNFEDVEDKDNNERVTM